MAKESGQSLLEVIFAISIISLVLGGFVSAVVYFSKTGQVSESGSRATQLAQEKMEELRADKKADASSFWNEIQSFVTATPTPETIDKYKRRIEVDYDNTGINQSARISIYVGWTEAENSKSVNLKSYFSEY